MAEPLLKVEGLRTYFQTDDGLAKAVDGVSFDLRKGETLGLVGESGCGKSATALSILRLIPEPPGEIAGGAVLFRGRDLFGLSKEEMRGVRGNDIAMIFQEPMTSLNPAFTCGDQIDEAVMLHQGLGRAAARERTVEMLRRVGIPDPVRRADEYPHRLSGGMRQRVMIGMALSCNPDLLIADEPTTALDVTIQAQILELLERLQQELGMAVLMITHDLGVIAGVADRVAVMYAGKIVEMGQVEEIFAAPGHPYTRGLLASIPKLTGAQDRLRVIPGAVPDATRFPEGCRFHPRCSHADALCREQAPALLDVIPGHAVACWKAEGYPA
ncbi:MAG: peptide ABC transporter ATP-binding protein [Candidatus Handelsmanbacteria bacterium RIFCSPLOWO2_12_FULL_64_10]|uniref:Peptide ABC transporter ATP-binding protein n=1 Tax=Handelsmanbacteria sp. (strain RIFCSPLOWO2_12_FULL_64_10) TaxID=1817868 RepID=A0A1F6CMR6_HANXR|nr:MAG: peptide ABC transporter ATP-binding protein [Candidatus Handelsmanbacteria bacterium RIFCSPLOWO2_12_FULL_64_10]